MYLARYARQSVLQWADVETNEIARFVKVLSDMLGEENLFDKGAEDR